MGTRIMYMEYDENVGKKNVQKNLDDLVREESLCIGELGLPSIIKWEEEKVFDDRVSARKYVNKSKRKAIAVKYRIPVELLKTGAIERQERKIKSMEKDKEAYVEKHCMINYSNKYFTCKNCGSKIATKYMRGNNCRVCGAETRSDKVLNTIKEFEDVISSMKNELDASIEELNSGLHGRWLVRIEYEIPEEVA